MRRTKKIIISRDVKFVEGVFPFSTVNKNNPQEEIFKFPNDCQEVNIEKEEGWINGSNGKETNPMIGSNGLVQESFVMAQNEENESPTMELLHYPK